MAKRVTTIVELTDDLDGSKADRTIKFGWHGTNYEIDLSKKNANAFEKLMGQYVAAARKAPTSARRTRSSGARGSAGSGRRSDLQEVRAWAKQQGLAVSDRGRIPNSVIEAYDAR